MKDLRSGIIRGLVPIVFAASWQAACAETVDTGTLPFAHSRNEHVIMSEASNYPAVPPSIAGQVANPATEPALFGSCTADCGNGSSLTCNGSNCAAQDGFGCSATSGNGSRVEKRCPRKKALKGKTPIE